MNPVSGFIFNITPTGITPMAFNIVIAIPTGVVGGSVGGDTRGDDTFEVTLVAARVGLAVSEGFGVVAIETRIATAEATRERSGATGLTSRRIAVTAIGAVAVAPDIPAVGAQFIFIVVRQSTPPRSEVGGATVRGCVPVCLRDGIIATTPFNGGLTILVVAVPVLNVNESWLVVGELSELGVEVLDVVATVEVLLELVEGKCDVVWHIVGRKDAWSVDACLIGAHTSPLLADWGVKFFHRSVAPCRGGGDKMYC